VELESFYRLSDITPQALPEPGDYALRFLQGETLLAAYPFTVTSGAPLTADEPDFTFFDLVVPHHAEATRIEVAYQQQVLTERAVSAHAPTVAVSLPQSTAPLTGTVPLTITAHDDDGDPLTYTLLSSADNGATWRVVTANFTETLYALDTLLLPGSDLTRLRVYASDGVNTGVATSTGFRLAHKAPLAIITSPAPGAYPPQTPIRLEGIAWDGEDEQLGELAIAWSSDTAGHLGDNDVLHWQNPAPGWHTLTFTATDSNGMTASDQVRVYIGYRLHLPVIAR
jgi:hypothetical protein